MDVSSAMFPSLVLRLLQEVADSHLVTVDFEFSGVAGHRPQGSGKLTLQEYYEDTKEAAEKYQVLQLGLTIVEEDLDQARYVVRPYNFNLSPLPALRERFFSRDWSANSGGRYSFTRYSTC
jgi:poly(A)-specific ribonuclease